MDDEENETQEEQGRIISTHDLTVGILMLSSIQGKPYEEQVEILGATVLRLTRELRQLLTTKGGAGG